MGKRYYCDYCDRSFQDNMHNRKKHLNGVQHHRAKKAWFDSFRDSAAILCEEQAKKPCRKFLQTGVCGFGHNCRFSHMSEEDFANLQRQIEYERGRREGPGDRPHAERSVEDWLARRDKKRLAPGSTGVLNDHEDEEDEEGDVLESNAPLELRNIPDLPPSLLPPPPGGWKGKMNTEWG